MVVETEYHFTTMQQVHASVYMCTLKRMYSRSFQQPNLHVETVLIRIERPFVFGSKPPFSGHLFRHFHQFLI